MRFSARALARVVACLVVLQGFLFAAGPRLAERAPSDVGWDAAVSQYCATQRDDGRSPRNPHEHQKCLACAVAGKCAPLILAAILIAAGQLDAAASDGAPPGESDDHGRRLIGWASSWSAHSPPAFS